MLSRRGFVGGLVGLVAAPAIVRAQNIMPVRMPAVLKPTKPVPAHSDMVVEYTLPGDEGVVMRVFASFELTRPNEIVEIARVPAGARILSCELSSADRVMVVQPTTSVIHGPRGFTAIRLGREDPHALEGIPRIVFDAE